MKPSLLKNCRALFPIRCLFAFLACTRLLTGAPTPSAISAFLSYSKRVESRLAEQHRSPNAFLAPPAASNPTRVERSLRRGELIVERITPLTGTDVPGALLHHWRGTAFAPGARAADFERMLRDFDSYPRYFYPQVLQAKASSTPQGNLRASMRLLERHVITVVLDATYDITFGQLDAQHRYSTSVSTRIVEIDSPGASSERALTAAEEHGFLWRLNTYWSFEERGGGLYLQIEALSLTRSIPRGLGWLIRPYVESIPRESLEFTLRSGCKALGLGASPISETQRSGTDSDVSPTPKYLAERKQQ